ncbi:MAG: hypothetical protein ACYTBJ_24260 [Planctomycetota bacterium]
MDLYADRRINLKDYALWAGNWAETGPCLDGDITGDGFVDMADLRATAVYWGRNCD